MPTLVHRLIFLKMRRLLELFIFVFFVVLLLSIGSKWSSSRISSSQYGQSNTKINPFLPIDPGLVQDNVKRLAERSFRPRPDLPKYIHLDLKGAPAQSTKFYEGFFHFIEQLQMGVKGFLIEYEDMLPLQGRFFNVSMRRWNSSTRNIVRLFR